MHRRLSQLASGSGGRRMRLALGASAAVTAGVALLGYRSRDDERQHHLARMLWPTQGRLRMPMEYGDGKASVIASPAESSGTAAATATAAAAKVLAAPPPGSHWQPPSREEMLQRLQGSTAAAQDEDEFDLLVIGGGATGTGVALDAASRGLRVALVERDDFAAGMPS